MYRPRSTDSKMDSRSETITSGSLMSLKRPHESSSMLPEDEDSQQMPTATAKDVDNYKLPKERENEEKSPLRAWKRLDWLLTTFQKNGQNCDAHTAVEATFRGDDLNYSSHVQPQPIATRFLPQPMPYCSCPSCCKDVIDQTNHFF